MQRLVNKVAVITGGSGGIGKATAHRFLEEGARVVLVDRDAEALAAVAEELGPLGEVLTVTADVSDEADTERFVREARERFGRIDVFFANAGIEGHVAPLVDQKMEDFDRVIAVNVRGVYLGLQKVLPVLQEQGSGSVITMSSVAGLQGFAGLSPYVTSKHAVVGMTRSAALEVAESGVRVNSVHPSPIETEMMDRIEEEIEPGGASAARKNFEQIVPFHRYGEPLDVANLVLFLASDESSYITGDHFRVDGGMGAQ
jgi:NAD(P)-dependent dehydrogenase (short-subunit alcohol dehydrogenase family)